MSQREKTNHAISVERLAVSYGQRQVLTDLSTTIEGACITALCGPNGCGKSTLLRTLAGLNTPVAGEVRLGEQNLASLSPRQLARQVAMLSQFNEVPSGMQVRELVAFGRYAHTSWLGGLSAADKTIVVEALEQVGLDGYGEREVMALSGGERQRAWIAMALAQNCPVLLLDEPTTWLDIRHQIEVLEQLRQVQRQQQLTLVWVLHDLHQAAAYSDRILLMREGKILHSGDVETVMEPARIREVYDIDMLRLRHPQSGTPLMVTARMQTVTDMAVAE